ncbi:MAG: serine/threonine-protein kinase [Phycisphaerales bacterium]
MPADTLEILRGDAPSETPTGASAGSSVAGSRAGSTGPASVDTILGQLVVDQGLATRDEVDAAATKLKDASDASLARILVDGGYVTERQLTRLRTAVEEERSSQQIPGFKVHSKLGAGAMATVFKATQISLDRTVAIKVLPRKFSSNQQFIERFYAEGRAAASLNHPNIVQAYDVGQAGEFHYFIMEFVEGDTVHDRIIKSKRFTEDEAITIMIAVADALKHAHDRGLIHRDVKPKNIMLSKDGVPKLADLGLARAIGDKEAALAEKGKAYGTPYYISPEQIRGDVDVGPQADIYGLGATLYHMVTGQVPFSGKNPTEVMQKHLKTPLTPPDHVNPKLSAGISEVIEMMTAKSRKLRYKNCADLLVDLKAVGKGETPPIAHKETPSSALAEFAQTTAEASAQQIAVDTSRPASPFSYPVVRVMLTMNIVLGIVSLTLLAILVMQMTA